MGVWAIVVRDLRQMGRHGLPLLVFLSLVLLGIGLVGMGVVADGMAEFGVNPGWTESWAGALEGDGEGVPNFTMMEVVYGYSVLVTMLLVTVAFVTNYNSEMKKGTVRTLTLYPMSVLGIGGAKLVYAALVGLLLSILVAFNPFVRLGRDLDVTWAIFLGAYLVTLGTVLVGALLGNGIAAATGRMVVRPTSFAFLLVLFSFVFTERILGIVVGAAGSLLGLPEGGAPLLALLSPLTFFSSYHHGAVLLSRLLGGSATVSVGAWLLTLLVILLGVAASRRLHPDIFERE